MSERIGSKESRATTKRIKPTPHQEAEARVRIGFAASADAIFRKLPERERIALMRKLKALALNHHLGKPLIGELLGHRRLTYRRLRCVVRASDEAAVLLVIVVALRTEGSRGDVYRLALKALRSDPSIEYVFAAHVRAYSEELRLAMQRRRAKNT